jgi:hypothetical protein
LINYTDHLTRLLRDIVGRVPALSFIDVADLFVFARLGRSNAEGAFATCHCLTLPDSQPGYYFWRDRATDRLTRRSEWFVTKSPVVMIESRPIKYMISFALPRFCDQALNRSRKEQFYPGADPWIAKLDTVVHELFHIDPQLTGIRRLERGDGGSSAHCHGQRFFEQVAGIVHTYLDGGPCPGACEFLREDFMTLERRYGGVVGTTFRTFPSFPQRYIERAAEQTRCEADLEGVAVEPLLVPQQPTRYTETDLHVRQFTNTISRQLLGKGAFRAA